MMTTVDLPDELQEQLEQVAERDGRSLEATILAAVERYVAEYGHRARVREWAQEVVSRDAELLDRLTK